MSASSTASCQFKPRTPSSRRQIFPLTVIWPAGRGRCKIIQPGFSKRDKTFSQMYFQTSFIPLSLDGTFAFSLGSVGARGGAVALCGDVTCRMSLLLSPLLIPRRRPRHIVIELLHAGYEYDGVLRNDSPPFCVFLTRPLLSQSGEETSKESRLRPCDLRCPFIEGTFASPWVARNSTSRPKASRNRADFAVPWLRIYVVEEIYVIPWAA
jgi:hypothetical protein